MRRVNCILCGSNRESIISSQIFDDEYLTLIDPALNKINRFWVSCKNCSFVYKNPQLENSEIETLYQKFRDKTFREESAEDYFNRIISLPKAESENTIKINSLCKKIPDHIKKGGNVLDIGAAGGVFLYSFLQMNKSWSGFAVEPTPEYAILAKTKLNCSIYEGFYQKDIFKTKFDLITCNQVLEHTIDPIKLITDIYNDLNHGGYLYLEVPDTIDFEELPDDDGRFLAQHLWYFSKSSIESIVKKVGFKVISSITTKTLRGRNNLISLLRKE